MRERGRITATPAGLPRDRRARLSRMDPMPRRPLVDLLEAELARHAAASVLLIGMRWPELPQPRTLQECRDPDALALRPASGERADLAVVVHHDDGLDGKMRLEHRFASLLASLRDVHTARVLLATPMAASTRARDAQREQLRALGYAELGVTHLLGQVLIAHRFDLLDYKPTPGWLNPGGWANPDMWNKHRW